MQNEEKLITLEEAAKYLNLSPRAIKILVKKGQVPAYRLAGKHLRFKKSQLDDLPAKTTAEENNALEPNSSEKIRDFIYFNDFYILSLILIILILYIIFHF